MALPCKVIAPLVAKKLLSKFVSKAHKLVLEHVYETQKVNSVLDVLGTPNQKHEKIKA